MLRFRASKGASLQSKALNAIPFSGPKATNFFSGSNLGNVSKKAICFGFLNFSNSAFLPKEQQPQPQPQQAKTSIPVSKVSSKNIIICNFGTVSSNNSYRLFKSNTGRMFSTFASSLNSKMFRNSPFANSTPHRGLEEFIEPNFLKGEKISSPGSPLRFVLF